MSGSWSDSPLRSAILGAGLTLGVAACAGDPAPEAEMARADLAVSHAEDANAGIHAPGPYALAQDKLQRAREAVADGRRSLSADLVDVGPPLPAVADAIAQSPRQRLLRRTVVVARRTWKRERGLGIGDWGSGIRDQGHD